jgi:hypothetical protein
MFFKNDFCVTSSLEFLFKQEISPDTDLVRLSSILNQYIQSCLKDKKTKSHYQIVKYSQCQWLTTVNLVTQEAEIRRIKFRSQPGQIV